MRKFPDCVAAGAILTGFYLWRRDLVANMTATGWLDFVANVLPKLFFLAVTISGSEL